MPVEVTFYPQEWIRDTAAPAEDHEPVSFTIPEEEAVVDGVLPADDSAESDILHEHEDAPDWVQEWDGPFYVTTKFVEDEN